MSNAAFYNRSQLFPQLIDFLDNGLRSKILSYNQYLVIKNHYKNQQSKKPTSNAQKLSADWKIVLPICGGAVII
ncbi:MAG: hypothetical protein OFPII_40270 [Osedax symbiont Rs1]|nr:MAG: hypothetical protein OFPII_40270 [Osedax symbiont Rs1]